MINDHVLNLRVPARLVADLDRVAAAARARGGIASAKITRADIVRSVLEWHLPAYLEQTTPESTTPPVRTRTRPAA